MNMIDSKNMSGEGIDTLRMGLTLVTVFFVLPATFEGRKVQITAQDVYETMGMLQGESTYTSHRHLPCWS